MGYSFSVYYFFTWFVNYQAPYYIVVVQIQNLNLWINIFTVPSILIYSFVIFGKYLSVWLPKAGVKTWKATGVEVSNRGLLPSIEVETEKEIWEIVKTKAKTGAGSETWAKAETKTKAKSDIRV